MLAFGEFVFDPLRRELHRQGALIKVDPQLLDLLACFLNSPGALISKPELVQRVWGGRAVADSAISVAVAKLRKVLGVRAGAMGAQEYIENRYGRGYRFLMPVTVSEATTSALPSTSARPSPSVSPLVGRSAAVQQLTAALGRSLRGEGGVVALLGEPGIGKTRLAETLERSARQQGVRTAWGRFLADGTPPLWPLVQVLRELNSAGMADQALQLLDEQLPESRLQLPAARPELDQGHWFDAGTALHRTLAEISSAVLRLSRQNPLLILLDDLQWADAASLRWLNYAVGEITRWPLLVLTTVRSTELGPETARNRELLRLLSQHACERVELSRLRESDIVEYISARFDDPHAHPQPYPHTQPSQQQTELARAVLARSEGNPFYMVELLRPWIGEALPQPAQLRLSGIALDLVRQRLADLPPETRDVLSAAAVVGHDFDLGLVSQITGRDAGSLLEALDGSLANDTVVASEQIPGAYAFGHELIREGLYADLNASERCRYHLRIGEALLRRRAAGVEVASVELAQHFLSALPQGDVGIAVAHARSAATASARVASHADARKLLQRAFEALKFGPEPEPYTLAALLIELAMVERVLGEDYNAHLNQGVALAREHGFGPLLALAGHILSPAPGVLARREAHSVLEAALEVLSTDEQALRSIVMARLAWTPPSCTSARKVAELLGAAETLAVQSRDENALATLRDAQLFFLAGPTTVARAELVAEAIDRDQKTARGLGFGTRYIATSTFRLVTSMQRGDALGMQRAIEHRTVTLARTNNIELAWHEERLHIVLRMNRGEFEGVADELEALRARAQRLRLQSWPVLWTRDYSEFLYWTGDVRQLATSLRPGIALAEDDLPTSVARKLRYMLDLGFLDEARRALHEHCSLAWLEDLPQDRDYLDVICHLAGVSAALGSREHCALLYEQLRPYPELYAAGISFHCAGSVSHYLGALAQVLGLDGEAVQHFTLAIEKNTQFGLRPRAVESQIALLRLLLGSSSVRDVKRAKAVAASAQELVIATGLTPWQRALDDLAAQSAS
ncbi:MAG: hypothetical protein RL701_1699 [Pseudomonadota bacterium]